MKKQGPNNLALLSLSGRSIDGDHLQPTLPLTDYSMKADPRGFEYVDLNRKCTVEPEVVEQCCQVAEIPAKKFKRGRGKRKLAGRIHGRNLAKCYQKWQKRGQRKFSKEILSFTEMTKTQKQRQSSIFISNCGFS
jgi:hypothetical protein